MSDEKKPKAPVLKSYYSEDYGKARGSGWTDPRPQAPKGDSTSTKAYAKFVKKWNAWVEEMLTASKAYDAGRKQRKTEGEAHAKQLAANAKADQEAAEYREEHGIAG